MLVFLDTKLLYNVEYCINISDMKFRQNLSLMFFVPLLNIFRYCMVLFAGIAAEALVYGEAEGGENDENLFRSISLLLEPPLSIAQVFLYYKPSFCLFGKLAMFGNVG